MSGLGSLVVDIKANAAQFIAGVDAAKKKAHSGASEITASFGTIAKAALASQVAIMAAQKAVGAFVDTFEAAGQAIDSEQAFGTAPKKFYDMKYAIESAGDSFAEIPGILGKLNTSLGELKAGEGKAKIFETLGLSVQKLKDSDPTDALRDIVKALQEIDDPTTRARVGTELLGKGYKDSANALSSFAAAGDKSSGVSLEMLKALDDLADQMGALQTEAKNSAVVFMGALAPSLLDIINAFDDAGTSADGLSEKLGTMTGGLVKHVTAGMNLLGYLVSGSVQLYGGIAQAAWDGVTKGADAAETRFARTIYDLEARFKDVDSFNKRMLAGGDPAAATDAAAAKRQEAQAKRTKEMEERLKRLKALLADSGGGGSKATDKIAEAFKTVQQDIDRATMSAKEFRLAQFKALGANDKQAQEYSVKLDTLEATERAKKLKEILAGLDTELQSIGKTDDEKAMLQFIERLRQAGATSEESAEALGKFKAKLAAEDAAKFADELAAINTEIEKIGKSAEAAAALDIRAKYKDNPEQMATMLAANARRYAELNKQGVVDIFKQLRQESASVGATPLTLYVNELREAQKLNPAITDGIITLAAAQKQAALDSAAAWEENARQAREASEVLVGGLEGVIWGANNGSDAADEMAKALGRMIVQALILKPILKELEAGFSSLGSGSSSGGNGWIGAAANFVGSFFGGGRAMGGATDPNSLHEVAEGGRPELYRWRNRTFLLTGSQGGTVQPARTSGGASGGGNSYIFQTTIDARGSSMTEAQLGLALKRSQEETLAKVQSLSDRGGAFANSVGRR